LKIQIGNRVKFLNDVGGGIVIGFTDEKYALIETDDGFELPVLLNELIPDSSMSFRTGDMDIVREPETSAESGQKNQQAEPAFGEKRYLAYSGNAFLAFVPQNEHLLHVSNFDLYLVNDSNYHFQYCISYKDSVVSTFIAAGVIEPDTKQTIGEYSQNTIGKMQELHLRGQFFKEGLMDAIPPVDRTSSLEGISFYKAAIFTGNDYFNEKALIMNDKSNTGMIEALDKLRDADFGKVVKIKEEKEAVAQHKSPKDLLLEEVDLHIEEIVDNSAGLSNGEIVNIQMSRFETALETAKRSKTQKIVFIHGIGNGKLKQELRKKLDRKYPDLRYQDASFKEYGYGATLVYLK
jgi:hypothetical protein